MLYDLINVCTNNCEEKEKESYAHFSNTTTFMIHGKGDNIVIDIILSAMRLPYLNQLVIFIIIRESTIYMYSIVSGAL